MEKGRNMQIKILELETLWKTCHRFEDETRGKSFSFQIETWQQWPTCDRECHSLHHLQWF